MKHKYKGAIHIHTKFSDGTANVYHIAKCAKKAGLDFIIITDHNNFEVEEGNINGVCVIKGEEISPPKTNHYLALGIKKLINQEENPQKYIKEVNDQGGFGFIAHPKESLNRKNHYEPIRWFDENIIGDGIEIWNYFSDWGDKFDEHNLFKMAYNFFFRNHILSGMNNDTRLFWDKINNQNEKIIPAIGGLDAHAMIIAKFLKIFPYTDMFKTLTNIVEINSKLPDDFNEKKSIILKAIEQGNNIIINRYWGDIIPEFLISNNTNSVYSGETIEYSEDLFLEIKMYKKVLINIYKDGNLFYTKNTNKIEIPIKEIGKYRFEAFFRGKPFVYSNPIKVK